MTNKKISEKEIIKQAHIIANNMNMPYCWEDIVNRLKQGVQLPVIIEK
jgi:hypothetical protein